MCVGFWAEHTREYLNNSLTNELKRTNRRVKANFKNRKQKLKRT